MGSFLHFPRPLSFTNSFPLPPHPTADTAGVPVSPVCLGNRLRPRERVGRPPPASHAGTRPSHHVCQAGPGGEPVSGMKSPNAGWKVGWGNRAVCWPGSTREHRDQFTLSPRHSPPGSYGFCRSPDVLSACSLMGWLLGSMWTDDISSEHSQLCGHCEPCQLPVWRSS